MVLIQIRLQTVRVMIISRTQQNKFQTTGGTCQNDASHNLIETELQHIRGKGAASLVVEDIFTAPLLLKEVKEEDEMKYIDL